MSSQSLGILLYFNCVDFICRVSIYDDRTGSYIQAIDDCTRSDPKLILCLVPNNNTERSVLKFALRFKLTAFYNKINLLL